MADAMTQVKFTIESDIVSAFKSRCTAEGVSMASMVREWMKTGNPHKKVKNDVQTRPHRKKIAQEIIKVLNDILEAEIEYRDYIPEHFTQRYEAADSACELLMEAISSLEEAF